jgi:hypothetical protein
MKADLFVSALWFPLPQNEHGGRLLRLFQKGSLFVEISDSDGMYVPDDAFVPVL